MRPIDADALLVGIEEYWETAHIQSVTRETEKARAVWSGIHGGANYCRNHILDAPTIEAEPVKHGRWELVVYKPIGHDYICSLCNFAACNEHNYCPNCGAKMDLEG